MNLQDELDELLVEDLRGRLVVFEPRVLSWLLLLPEWTEAEWPFGRYLIDQFDDSGLIERRETIDGGDAFWVRDSVRPGLARYVREVRGTELEEDVAALARSSWLRTLTPYRRDPSGRALMDTVEQLLGDGQVGEATRLTATARLLGEALNEPLADAARRARWRIDRAVRTAEDQRQLRYYVNRASVEAELTALGGSSGRHYGLHLLGGGGTGKTMVIRYLCSTSKTPVARIDFDHLDPRYPDQRPGEILLALAGELLGYGATRQAYSSYRRLQDTADALHEELASDVRPREPSFAKMIGSFARFIEVFPQPVLLVLDTCEELAKLYPPGTEAPAIDRTFEILDQVHDLVRSVRFVFAGRRWLVRPPDGTPGAASPRLRPRPWVRVLPFTGFTRTEAEDYLRKRDVQPGAMAGALLRRSAAGDGSYSPFELAAYCEWALTDPGLDPGELQDTPGDPLVERRIIGRVKDRIRAAIPIAAALGRFDLDLITPALRRSGLDPQAAFSELASHEWMNVLSVDMAGRPRVIEVDEHLCGRILQVTAARHPVNMHALGRDALAAVKRSPLPELPTETVEAAIRLLPVADAGAFWADLEMRVTAEQAWAWAGQASIRAGAVESVRADGRGQTILAAILATQAAARIHTANSGDVIPLWREVERHAYRHPDPRQRRSLALRGLLGRIAAGDPEADPDSVTNMTGDDLAGSFAAAAQRMVAEGHDASRLVNRYLVACRDRRIAAVGYCLLSVLALWKGKHNEARVHADAAVAQAVGDGSAHADWVPPRRLADRCRLTRLFVAWASGERPPVLPWEAWRNEAIDHLDDIDAERLVSLTLRYEHSYHALPDELIERIRFAEYYAPRRPVDWLHLQVRPLLVELVLASWTVRDQGFVMLQQRIDEAVAAGDDPDTVDACQLAQMRLCRRHRYADTRVMLLSREAASMVRAEAWLVRELVSGDGPATVEDAGSWHGWWQCQTSLARLPEPPAADPEISPDILRADRVEYRAHLGLPPSAIADVGPPSFDPEQILRGGGSLDRMAPGELGRALLAVGEVLALRSPAKAATLLFEAVEPLIRAGDEGGAAQAAILAILAGARANCLQAILGKVPDLILPDLPLDMGETASLRTSGTRASSLPGTWASRLAVARSLYWGGAPPALHSPDDSAPELRLTAALEGPAFPPPDIARPVPAQAPGSAAGSMPPSSPLRQPSAPPTPSPMRPRTSMSRWTELGLGLAVALVPIGGIAILALSSSRSSGSSSSAPYVGISLMDIVWMVIAVLAVVAAAAVPRIGVYRRFASPSLRGFRFIHSDVYVTVTGCQPAVVDRRPMVRLLAWRPIWRRSIRIDLQPSTPAPTLRIRRKRPTIIRIKSDSPQLDDKPWEQWLGRSYTPSRRANLLFFRSECWALGGTAPRVDWSRATYAYQGPAHILDVTPLPGGNVRALHLVGTPVGTRDGWRFRVSMTGAATRKSRGTEEGETLISPNSIVQTPPLVILQADPVDSGAQSLGEDRRGYVGLAHEYLGTGATAVLVIPPLDDELATAIANHVRDTIMGLREPPRPTALLLLLSALKRQVPDVSLSAGHEDPALDLLLFLNSPK